MAVSISVGVKRAFSAAGLSGDGQTTVRFDEAILLEVSLWSSWRLVLSVEGSVFVLEGALLDWDR